MDTRKRSSASRSDSNGYPGPKFGSQFSDPEGYVDDIPEEGNVLIISPPRRIAP